MNCEKAYNLALRYISSRMRTEKEVRKNLKDKGCEEDFIEQCVELLKNDGLIDDITYGTEFIRYAIGKKRGKRRIAAELKEKGLNEEAIKKAFFAYEDEYGELDSQKDRAIEIAREHFTNRIVDDRSIAAFGRKLYRQGFEQSDIYAAIKYIEGKRENYE